MEQRKIELQKWKEERQRKKEIEKKLKKPFVVTRVQYPLCYVPLPPILPSTSTHPQPSFKPLINMKKEIKPIPDPTNAQQLNEMKEEETGDGSSSCESSDDLSSPESEAATSSAASEIESTTEKETNHSVVRRLFQTPYTETPESQ